MDPILTTIDQALARSGLTDAAASKLAVGNPSLIKNMRLARGEEKRYSFQSLQELARVLGLDCYFGPKRELAGFSEGDAKSDLGRVEAIRGGYLPIPWHDAAKRKGSSPVAFLQSWLASESLIPDVLKAIVPTSIQLSLADSKNTVAVIDTSSPRKGSSGLWCYLDGASIGICRAAFSADVTVLFPPEDDGDIKIIAKPGPPAFQMLGKVVWLGLLTNP
jgi:hypothetical protein